MKQFKVGDRVRCIRSDSFLCIKAGLVYTVSGIGGNAHSDDPEWIKLAELPGSAFRTFRFVLIE